MFCITEHKLFELEWNFKNSESEFILPLLIACSTSVLILFCLTGFNHSTFPEYNPTNTNDISSKK